MITNNLIVDGTNLEKRKNTEGIQQSITCAIYKKGHATKLQLYQLLTADRNFKTNTW